MESQKWLFSCHQLRRRRFPEYSSAVARVPLSFSNLDPELRVALRYELQAIVRRAGITTILVTHDQGEAFALADRIAVMHVGQIHQVADPETSTREI